MKYHADLHIHSSYSRATSSELTIPNLWRWAQLKGLALIGTGDCIHPGWLDAIRAELTPGDDGYLRLRQEPDLDVPVACRGPVRFILTTEISNIYKRGGEVRKVHNLLVLSSLEAAARLQEKLGALGNIRSDGRPILGLDSRDLLEILLGVDPAGMLIPAHIWTPWFSVLGSKSGFDAIADCYVDLTPHIHALETGLSSDPPMNWRLSSLDPFALVSNSDAHSPAKLGRESTVFDTDFTYEAMRRALADPVDPGLVGTVEFFPEEGKYHFDGHRACQVRWTPEQTAQHQGVCPKCGKPVTVGVMARVVELADRPEGARSARAREFRRYVPLVEIVAQVQGQGESAKGVQQTYQTLLEKLGSELHVLGDAPLDDIRRVAGPLVAEGVRRVRGGEIDIAAGYDGEFGTVTVLSDEAKRTVIGQTSVFGDSHEAPRRRLRHSRTGTHTVRAERVEARTVAEVTAVQGLDPAQQQAVDYDGGHLLIVAGPGTGKTHTLTRRIARFAAGLETGKELLAVTFTRRAAAEMSQRLQALLGDGAGRVFVGTFHQFCLTLLREFPADAGVSVDFTVASAEEAEELAGEIWPDDKASLRRERLEAISCWKGSGGAGEPPPQLGAYDQALRLAGKLDFDDLILEPLRLLRRCPELLTRVSGRYAGLFVDEFQDVNAAQVCLVETLGTAGVPVTAIGDPGQSIYGFRGAVPAVFERFASSLPSVGRVRLTANYRSAPAIVQAFGQVGGGDAALEAVQRLQGRIVVRQAASDKAEAEYVVHQIERLVGGTSMFSADSGRVESHAQAQCTFGDIAVLHRVAGQRPALVEALERSGVPYRVGSEEPHEGYERSAEHVAVLTMHAAKGLEFQVVFVVGCEEGLLPLHLGKRQADVGEEQRLFYVAMSRARQALFLTCCAGRFLQGSRLPGRPSRFLAAIEQRLLETDRSSPGRGRGHAPEADQLSLFRP